MNDFQKSLTRFMYMVLIVAAGLTAWALARPAWSRQDGPSGADLADRYGPRPRGVTATGTCIVRTKLEMVNVTIGVTRTTSTAREANSYVKSRITKVIQVLRNGGVAAKDIQTQNFGLARNWNSERKVMEWTANETLRVKVRRIGTVADLIDDSVKVGANHIGGLEYTVDDVNALRAKGRAQAAKVARAKAQQLASSLGGKLGTLVVCGEDYPGESGGYWRNYGYSGSSYRTNVQANVQMDEPRADDTAPAEITIQPGQLVMTVAVTATYELE